MSRRRRACWRFFGTAAGSTSAVALLVRAFSANKQEAFLGGAPAILRAAAPLVPSRLHARPIAGCTPRLFSALATLDPSRVQRCLGPCKSGRIVVAAAAVATCASKLRPLDWIEPAVSFGDRFVGPRRVPGGLKYCRDFVSLEEEQELLKAVDGAPNAWTRYIRRAQQFFGLVYYQTSQPIAALQPTDVSPKEMQLGRSLDDLPDWLLPRILSTGVYDDRRGVNQVQANEYLEDSGIGLHVEDPAAGPAFATLSLLQPVQMTLQRAVNGKPMKRDERDQHDCMKILLEPRSLLVFEGESRQNYAHAIRQSKLVHLPDGEVLRRGGDYRRVSLTFRGIIEEQRRIDRQDMPDGYVTYSVRNSEGASM